MTDSTDTTIADLVAQRQAVRDQIAAEASATLPVDEWVRLQHEQIRLSKAIFLLGGK